MFRRSPRLLQHVVKYELGLGVTPDLIEQTAVADSRLGSRIVARNGFVFAERLLRPAARLERASIQKVAFCRLIIRPTSSERIQSGHGFLRAAQAKFGSRFSESEDRIVAERQTENVVVMVFSFLEFAERKAFLGHSTAIRDRVEVFEFVDKFAIAPPGIERMDDLPPRVPRPGGFRAIRAGARRGCSRERRNREGTG